MKIAWKNVKGRLTFDSHRIKASIVGSNAIVIIGQISQEFTFCNIGQALTYIESVIRKELNRCS